MQEISIESHNALNGPVSNASTYPVGQDGLPHRIADRAIHGRTEASMRQWRRDRAAYWLNTARGSLSSAKKMKGSGKDIFMRFAMAEMMLYAKWKARAERAEW